MTRWSDAGLAVLDVAAKEDRGPGIHGVVGDALFASAFGHLEPLAAHGWIQRAIDDLEANGTEVSLHRGVAGLGLVIAMYRSEEEELLAAIDELIATQLESLPAASMHSGAAGIALYASLRTRSETGAALGRAVVEKLRASATPSDPGVVWHTPAEYASARGLDVRGEPVLEYGMMHGAAGALVGLAALAARGDATATELARAGLVAAWTHARAGANRFGRVLFGRQGALGTVEFDAPRWCVGDPGVLRALWLTARTVGDTASAERAAMALREDAANDARGGDRLDGRLDLCCGAAAVAQVYLRMHRETGEAVFRDANAALLARCAEGYDRLEHTTFRHGRMGVLLALMTAEHDGDPRWDAMLGMSLPCAVGE